MIKAKLIDFAKKNKIFRKISRQIIYLKDNFKYSIFVRKYKINDKMIVFESYMGKDYACSPKAIYEYLQSQKKYQDYKFIWAFKDPHSKKDQFKDKKNTILIEYGSKDYYKYYAMSKYWITNTLINAGIKKKKNQVYLQCWHGTPLKKLRCDILNNGGSELNSKEEIYKRNIIDTKKIDYFISPSKFCTDKFTSAFDLKNLNKESIIIERGYPRNDFLYKYNEKDIIKFKNELKIPKNKKIIFYAPTFRDDEHKSGVGYTYNLNIDFDTLKEELGKEYIILFRPHYFIANQFDFKKYKDFIYDVTNVDDINYLYIISDYLMTDYSSVFFDYANLKKPIIFYMYDIDKYKSLRNFYIDIDELPGSIIKDKKDIAKSIKEYNPKLYKEKYDEFNKKFNYLDSAHSSEKVAEVVFNEKNI